MSNAPDHADDGALPAIEFRSPGRFAIHNPPAEAIAPDGELRPPPSSSARTRTWNPAPTCRACAAMPWH